MMFLLVLQLKHSYVCDGRKANIYLKCYAIIVWFSHINYTTKIIFNELQRETEITPNLVGENS